MIKEQEEQKPAQQAHANGTAVPKAAAPDAKQMLTAKTMSLADQVATGLLTAGEHLQVCLCASPVCCTQTQSAFLALCWKPFVRVCLPYDECIHGFCIHERGRCVPVCSASQ